MSSVLKLLRSGMVRRYHIQPTTMEQNVAAHSWGVAMIYLAIADAPKYVALRSALTHDCAELYTGDTPAHVKWANPDLKVLLDRIESKFEMELDIDFDISAEDKRLIKAADMLELIWWCRQQVYAGNRNYQIIIDRGVDFFTREGFPNEKTRALLARILAEDMFHV